ncbi:hypothetical protein TARUN_9811 [Trichoderma arundinaceum]|uniref:YCII-related domain-containing protein n=1 Tax=Trichoderma arundinaceum TaxID=490622 RepID=A0A395N8W2_TRIAR|nr:hypothetical protein TARUN_9811 [Trichoderma arundinaceum]
MFFSRHFIAFAAFAAIAISAETKPLEYFIYAPAQSDSGMLARQKVAAEAHLAHANSLNATGNLDYGGPVLTASSTAANPTFAGSVFVLKVENLEAAKKVVEDDAYYTGNVWDPKKIVILPYIPFF